MKVAFCFSGLLRDVDKNKNYWLAQIKKYNADVYASFWDIENPENGDTLLNFVSSFKPKKIESESFSAFEKTTLNPIKKHIAPKFGLMQSLHDRCKSGSIFSMWYKIWRSNILRSSNNIEYDVIVRCRTDMFFEDDLNIELNPYLNVPIGKTKADVSIVSYGCNDMFAYGNENIMNHYSNLYNKLYFYFREGHYLFPAENILRVHLNKTNISIKEIPQHLYLTYDWSGNKLSKDTNWDVKFNAYADKLMASIYTFNDDIVLDPNCSFYADYKAQKVKIEVGANFGHDTENLAADGSIVYAFEPTHELLTKLWERFKENPNVRVLPFAVDVENGFAEFKIAGHHDWGCSSLYNFSGEWERDDFYVNDRYTVPKITLFDFCNMYKVEKIDYLWIDAQGNDYNCLLSLGDKIDIVKAGQCEVAMNKRLYNGTQNDIEVVKPWLESHGFHVTVKPDPIEAEANLIFERI